MKNPKMLVVRRMATLAALTAFAFENLGYHDITEVMSCGDAIPMVGSGEFALVITEVETNEGPTGYDLIKAVRQLGGKTKVILLVDKAAAEKEDGGFADPPDAVLGTPFTQDEFEKVVGLTLRET